MDIMTLLFKPYKPFTLNHNMYPLMRCCLKVELTLMSLTFHIINSKLRKKVGTFSRMKRALGAEKEFLHNNPLRPSALEKSVQSFIRDPLSLFNRKWGPFSSLNSSVNQHNISCWSGKNI